MIVVRVLRAFEHILQYFQKEYSGLTMVLSSCFVKFFVDIFRQKVKKWRQRLIDTVEHRCYTKSSEQNNSGKGKRNKSNKRNWIKSRLYSSTTNQPERNNFPHGENSWYVYEMDLITGKVLISLK